jgi:hypothetical protein
MGCVALLRIPHGPQHSALFPFFLLLRATTENTIGTVKMHSCTFLTPPLLPLLLGSQLCCWRTRPFFSVFLFGAVRT